LFLRFHPTPGRGKPATLLLAPATAEDDPAGCRTSPSETQVSKYLLSVKLCISLNGNPDDGYAFYLPFVFDAEMPTAAEILTKRE